MTEKLRYTNFDELPAMLRAMYEEAAGCPVAFGEAVASLPDEVLSAVLPMLEEAQVERFHEQFYSMGWRPNKF